MKQILYVVLILSISLFLVGCSADYIESAQQPYYGDLYTNNTDIDADINQNADNQVQSPTEIQFISIDSLLNRLDMHFELGEKEEAYYQMIGAYDGTKIDVDNTKIEVYQYKESQKDSMKSAQDMMDTADNQIFIVDDTFLILVHTRDSEISNEIKIALSYTNVQE